MKVVKTVLLIVFSNCLGFLFSQNLIVNPGFENHAKVNQIQSPLEIAGWRSLSKNSFLFTNPDTQNLFSRQSPRNGNSYAGFYALTPALNHESNGGEFLVGTLVEPLRKDSIYFFEWFVSLSEFSISLVQNLGAAFAPVVASKDVIYRGNPLLGGVTYNALPQVKSADRWFISDSLTWLKLAGIFRADGNEQHVILGCFDAASNKVANTYNRLPSRNIEYHSIYFVDDVAMFRMDLNLPDTIYLCEGMDTVLDASVNPFLDAIYHWDDGSADPIKIVNEPGKYFIQIAFRDYLYHDSVTVLLLPNHLDLGRDTSFCEGESFTLRPQADFPFYKWQNGSNQDSFIVSNTGVFHLKTSNACGGFEDDITVERVQCSCSAYIPNVFSPNQAAQNEIFHPFIYCDNAQLSGEYLFQIFNRWGDLVFSCDQPEIAWDGSIKGIAAEMGVYFLLLKYHVTNPEGDEFVEQFSGAVNLIR